MKEAVEEDEDEDEEKEDEEEDEDDNGVRRTDGECAPPFVPVSNSSSKMGALSISKIGLGLNECVMESTILPIK